jgi:hypothetical protein
LSQPIINTRKKKVKRKDGTGKAKSFEEHNQKQNAPEYYWSLLFLLSFFPFTFYRPEELITHA